MSEIYFFRYSIVLKHFKKQWSFISGLFPPTKGTATVGGFDIVKEMKQVRQSIGLCPQHDVLFDQLTVAEHIRFFSKVKLLYNINFLEYWLTVIYKQLIITLWSLIYLYWNLFFVQLKGLESDKVDMEVNNIIESLKLVDKKDAQVRKQ